MVYRQWVASYLHRSSSQRLDGYLSVRFTRSLHTTNGRQTALQQTAFFFPSVCLCQPARGGRAGRLGVALTGTVRLASVECAESCQSRADLQAKGSDRNLSPADLSPRCLEL